MSRSNNTDIRNPANLRFSWMGDKKLDSGKMSMYNVETKEKVTVELPFTFVVLDQMHSITGFNKPQKIGYYANEVRDITSQPLIVRPNGGRDIYAEGLYKDIQNTKFLKYAKNIYVAYKQDDELVIGRLDAAGTMNSEFIEFAKTNNVYKCAVQVVGSEFVKGDISYHKPLLKALAVSPETDAEALALDEELQVYLTEYLKQPVKTEQDVVSDDEPASFPDEEYDPHPNSPTGGQSASANEPPPMNPPQDAASHQADDEIPF